MKARRAAAAPLIKPGARRGEILNRDERRLSAPGEMPKNVARRRDAWRNKWACPLRTVESECAADIDEAGGI